MGGRRYNCTRGLDMRNSLYCSSKIHRAVSDARHQRLRIDSPRLASGTRHSSLRVLNRSVLSISRSFRLAALVRKAQSAMEFLMVVMFAFLILFGILMVAYVQTSTFQADVTAAQVQKVGNSIVDAANAAYYAGPPTKKTITLYFPENINSVVLRNQTIIFTVQSSGGAGNYEYAVFAATNMTGSIRKFSGLHVVTIEALDTVVNITDGG